MDHAIGLVDVGDGYARRSPLRVDDEDLPAGPLNGKLLTFNCGQHFSVGEIGRLKLAGNDVISKDLGQGRLVLWLYQRGYRALRQFAKGGIGRARRR